MSSEFMSKDDEVVAVRFWGGDRGVVVQMEVSEREFEAFAEMRCFENGNDVGSFAEFVEEWRSCVVWDSAARRNENARAMEKWMEDRSGGPFEVVRDQVEMVVAEMRDHAKAAARDGMRGV